MTSLTALSHLIQVSSQLEELRQKLNEPIVPLTNENILTISTKLQPLYKKLLITNLDDALARQLENGMWNDCFKTPLTRFGRTDKNLFHLMIEAGVGFYLGLIQDIGIHFDISFITNTTATNKLYCTKTSQSPLVNPSKVSVYYIIQNCLLHVGDLLRYRGSFPEALKMYEKSAAVCPSNGYPFHQMAISQLLIYNNGDEHSVMNNFLSSFYYFVRAMATANPHLHPYQAFDSLTNKIMNTPPNNNKYHDFIRQYLLTIYSTLGSDQQPSPGAYNMVPLLSPLVTNQQLKPTILFQMIIIALWAQWKNANGNCSSEEFTLEIIAGIINSILIAAIGLLGSGDVGDSSSPGGNSIDRRFFCIPHLKLLVDWLVRLQQSKKSAKQLSFLREKVHIGTLVKFLNQIKAYTHQADGDLNSSFILPEEKRLIGFIPLDYSAIRSSGGSLLEEGNSKTQKVRIHRLIKAAIKLSSNDNISGLNFMGYDGSTFTESKGSPLTTTPTMPSRRNVALTSIFRSGSQTGLDTTSPTTPSSRSGFASPNDIFRSIWTPDGDNNSSSVGFPNSDTTWN